MYSGRARHSSKSSAGDDVFSKRYNLNHSSLIYSLNGSLPYEDRPSATATLDYGASIDGGIGATYPDFNPWKHTAREDDIAVNNVQKGCIERPLVQNELLSARGAAHSLLKSFHDSARSNRADNNSQLAGKHDSADKSPFNPIERISKYLIVSLNKRNNYNRIVKKSTFRPPPRVTLTEQKKELWLRNLANSSISLRKLLRTIPHGIRNKTLLDQIISKKVPVDRAIWFIKCVGLNELRLLKRKNTAYGKSENTALHAPDSSQDNEIAWINEWTKQVTNYLENLLSNIILDTIGEQPQGPNNRPEEKFDSNNLLNSSSLKFKLSYLSELIRQLFIENLINKRLFLNVLINNIFEKAANFDEIYILLSVFIKSFLNFILKNFIIENYYVSHTDTKDKKQQHQQLQQLQPQSQQQQQQQQQSVIFENDDFFYTNLLKRLVEILILKYEHVFSNFNTSALLSSDIMNIRKANSTGGTPSNPTINSNRMAHTPTLYPGTVNNVLKTPNLLANAAQAFSLAPIQSPYGLNSISSPFANNINPESASADPNTEVSQINKEINKLAVLITRLRKGILTTIKVFLINLFALNNGDLFLLPKKWDTLKEILLKYNILNTSASSQLLDSTAEDFNSSVLLSEASSATGTSPGFTERKDSNNTKNNCYGNTRSNAHDENFIDCNSILRNGLNFNISPDNFIIKNNTKILLKKLFDLVNFRNESLYNNILCSLKELKHFEKNYQLQLNKLQLSAKDKKQLHQRKVSLNLLSNFNFDQYLATKGDITTNKHFDQIICKSLENSSNLSYKVVKILNQISNYEFFYICDLSNSKGCLERTGSFSTSAKGKKFKKRTEGQLSTENFSATNDTDSSKFFHEKVNELINVVFDDFKHIQVIINSVSVTARQSPSLSGKSVFEDSNINEGAKGTNNKVQDANAMLSAVKKRFHVILKWCVINYCRGKVELLANSKKYKEFKKIYLIVYIIKQSVVRFRACMNAQLNELTSNADLSNKSSPSELGSVDAITETDDMAFAVFGDTGNSPSLNSSFKNGFSKKQAVSNFKQFLQNEILEFIFSINNEASQNSRSNNNLKTATSLNTLVSSIFGGSVGEVTTMSSKLIEGIAKAEPDDIKATLDDFRLRLDNINLESLLLLINTLLDSKIVSINSYLRKLISSGLLYLRNSKDFGNLNLLQYFILKNMSVKVNNSNSNNAQFNLILKNLKNNITTEHHKAVPNLLISNLFDENVSALTIDEKILIGKKILQDKVLEFFFNDRENSNDYDLSFLYNSEIGIKTHLASWLYHIFQQKLLNNSGQEAHEEELEEDTIINITTIKLSLLFEIFSGLGKIDYFFNLIRVFLTIHINTDFIVAGNKNESSLMKIGFGYFELYYFLRILWYHLDIINYLTDFGDVEVEFESKYLLVIRTINFKPVSTLPRESSSDYLQSIEFLKLIVNNYLKLNDITNSLYGDLAFHNSMLNVYNFIEFWKLFLASFENYEENVTQTGCDAKKSFFFDIAGDNTSLNNLKNQLAYLTTEPSFFSSIEESGSFAKLIDDNLVHSGIPDMNVANFIDKDQFPLNCNALLDALVKQIRQEDLVEVFGRSTIPRSYSQIIEMLLLLKKHNNAAFDLVLLGYIKKNLFGYFCDDLSDATKIKDHDYVVKAFYLFVAYELVDTRVLLIALISFSEKFKERKDLVAGKDLRRINSAIKDKAQQLKDAASSASGFSDINAPSPINKAIATDGGVITDHEIFGKNFNFSKKLAGIKKAHPYLVNFTFNLLIENLNNVGMKLTNYEIQSLELRRLWFRIKHVSDYNDLMTLLMYKDFNIVARSTPQITSSSLPHDKASATSLVATVPGQFKDDASYQFHCLQFLTETAFQNVGTVVEKVIYNTKIDFDQVLDIYNTTLRYSLSCPEDVEFEKIETKSDIHKLVNVVNEYNLPICQLIVLLIMNKELHLIQESISASHPSNNISYKEEVNSLVQEVLMKVLAKCFVLNISQGKSPSIGIIGDLFVCIRGDLNNVVLNESEKLFLKSAQFPKLCLINDELNDPAFSHISDPQASQLVAKFNNFVPYIAMIINSISKNLQLNVAILGEGSISLLSMCLEKILASLSPNEKGQQKKNNKLLAKSIFVYLNILLIHKIAIVHLLHQKSTPICEKFVNNLQALLKSAFLKRHSQLKNLLYDLLFSLKSNLDELYRISASKNPVKYGKSEHLNLDHDANNASFMDIDSVLGGNDIFEARDSENSNHQSAIDHGTDLSPNSQDQNNNTSTGHGNSRITVTLPKMSHDDYNVELTKNLLIHLIDSDQLASESSDGLCNELVLYDETTGNYYDLALNPFDLLEEPNPVINVNDTSISLKLFGATLDLKNPA